MYIYRYIDHKMTDGLTVEQSAERKRRKRKKEEKTKKDRDESGNNKAILCTPTSEKIINQLIKGGVLRREGKQRDGESSEI